MSARFIVSSACLISSVAGNHCCAAEWSSCCHTFKIHCKTCFSDDRGYSVTCQGEDPYDTYFAKCDTPEPTPTPTQPQEHNIDVTQIRVKYEAPTRLQSSGLAPCEFKQYVLSHQNSNLQLVAVYDNNTPMVKWPGPLHVFTGDGLGIFDSETDDTKSCVRLDIVHPDAVGYPLGFNMFETQSCTKGNYFDKDGQNHWEFSQSDLGTGLMCMTEWVPSCDPVIHQENFGRATNDLSKCGSGWTSQVVKPPIFAVSQERPWTGDSAHCDECQAQLGKTFVCANPRGARCSLAPDEGSCSESQGTWCGKKPLHPRPSVCCGEGQVGGYCCRDFGSDCKYCNIYTYGVSCTQSNDHTYNATCGPLALEPSQNATIVVV